MTKPELDHMEYRIEEINNILEICDERFDADVIENLEYELEGLIYKLEAFIQQEEKMITVPFRVL